MTNATGEASQSGAVFWRLYMLSWVALAGAALLYLSAAVVRPDLLKPLIAQPAVASSMTDDVITTKFETLERSIDSLESRVTSVASEVREVRKIATSRPNPSAVKSETPNVAANAPTPTQSEAREQVPQQVAEQPRKLESQVAAGNQRIPPLPSKAPERKRVASSQTLAERPDIPLVILNGVAAAGISTGSVDGAAKAKDTAASVSRERLPEVVKAAPPAQPERTQPVVAFGKPVIQPAPGGGVASAGTSNSIVVSVAGSIDKLRSDWDLLLARHPELLRNLQPRYDIMAANGPYRLLAGPLTTRSEAGQLCTVLQLHGVTCDVEDNFLGNAL